MAKTKGQREFVLIGFQNMFIRTINFIFEINETVYYWRIIYYFIALAGDKPMES